MAVTGQFGSPLNCAGCAFWLKQREKEGVCRRHAPETSNRPEQVSHWPETHSWQWCGEGVAAAPLSIGSRCADCVFWRHPDGGLNPVNRGDMPMAWWAHAGICARHAPRPDSEPGPRAFWRATQATDFCADGMARERGHRAVDDVAATVTPGAATAATKG
jgi:hypothetical protein